MKNILFDLFESQPASTSKYHGGGEYIKKVFKNVVVNYKEKCNLIVFYDKDKFIDEWIVELIRANGIKEYFIKEHKDIEKIFDVEKIDTFYSGLPYYYDRSYIPDGVRFMGTVHGLRFLELPGDKLAHVYSRGIESIKEKIR